VTSRSAGSRLNLTREQILAFRRTVQSLDERLPPGPESRRRAAWLGLQDSMPRAALLSIHARVDETEPDAWEQPPLTQVWGPRFSAYVVAEPDAPLFTLARMPESGPRRRFGTEIAARLHEFLDGRRMTYGEAGRALGVHPNALRYGTLTGTIRIRWEGARQPTIWTVPPPKLEPAHARRQVARRFLHAFGPATSQGFADWAGIKPAVARATFDELESSLVPVRTPIGEAWLLEEDEEALRSPAHPPPAAARLLPSGDTYYLLQGIERELLVPEADRRALLWTSRVWPGAVLVRGEIVGTWRRADAVVDIQPWRRLSRDEQAAVEAEASSLPLPGLQGRIVTRWES
jgi:hypothetical protein